MRVRRDWVCLVVCVNAACGARALTGTALSFIFERAASGAESLESRKPMRPAVRREVSIGGGAWAGTYRPP